jgi:hypothetical protein
MPRAKGIGLSEIISIILTLMFFVGGMLNRKWYGYTLHIIILLFIGLGIRKYLFPPWREY